MATSASRASAAGRLAVILLGLSVSADAAFLRNVPQRVVQPDGTIVEALATGDEYYHRLHDSKGFTIVQDPVTGSFVYAEKVDGSLYPTALRPGQDDPALAGLEPNLLPRRDVCTPADSPQDEYGPSARIRLGRNAAGAVTGAYANIVIFIRFADQAEFGSTITPWETVFNGAAPAPSVRAFYEEASYGQMSFQSIFVPLPAGGMVVSYQDSHPRRYYSPYNLATNPEGYRTTSDPTTSRSYRESTLLENAVLAVAAQVPSGTVVDVNGDGYVDAVSFIVQGAADGWNELLWPHMAGLYDPAVQMNGKTVGSYTFDPEAAGQANPASGIFCHELGHVLGFPDLYHYNMDGLEPVGIWDMMSWNQTHFSAHTKLRYVQWIASIPEITASGTYNLNPLTSATGNAWKIASPNAAGEYFVVEYRRKSGAFEGYLPASGLLVYRINPAVQGNSAGPPDEVYVYRPGGTLTADGNLNAAQLSADSGRVSLDDTTNPSSFLSDGTQGRLRIYNVGAAGATISFNVEILSPCYSVGRAVDPPGSGTVSVTGTQNCPGGYAGGTTVNLAETPGVGVSFLGWTISGGTASNLASPSTTFTIGTGPAANPSVTAVFGTGAETALSLGVPHADTTGPAGAMKYFYVSVPPGYDSFVVSVSGASDLYVSAGSRPTTAKHGCNQWTWGGASPYPCAFQQPSSGIWWIGVQEPAGGVPVIITASAFTTIPTSERDALTALWTGTGGSNWWRSAGWRDAAGTAFGPWGSECTWYGVSCGGNPSRVIGLRLGSNTLSGTIPNLSALTALEVLDFGYDGQLTAGPVPAWVTSLVSLKELWLQSTNRNGPLPDLSSLVGLEIVELGYNSFDSGPCPVWIAGRPLLRRVGLVYSYCTGTFPDLSASTGLEALDLRGTSLTLGPTPVWLTALTTLREVRLGYTRRTGTLPNLSASTGLQVIDLGGNPFNSGPVPAWMAGMTSLRELDLRFTNRDGTLPDLSPLSGLRVLNLSYNGLLTATPVPAWITNLPALYSLDFSGTNRTGSIPASLGGLAELMYLYLNDNQLSGVVPPELRSLTSLWMIDLSRNQLTGALPQLDNVGGSVYLGSNRFDAGPIPAWLNGRPIWGLDLANTSRTGPLPSWLGSMPSLYYLLLNGNQLTGGVPSQIQSLVSLNSVDLRWNALSTTDAAVRVFVNARQYGADFEATQTVAPQGVAAGKASSTTVSLSWSPIRYQADGGGYRIYGSTTSGGPYTLATTVASKGTSSAVVTGLAAGTTNYFVFDAYTPSHANNNDTVVSGLSAEVAVTLTPAGTAGLFYALPPCRVLDTRNPTGPLGAPALQSGATRTFDPVASTCGIPADAVAISANLTVTNVGALGELVVFPADVLRPNTSALSFRAGRTRANNAIVSLSNSSMTFSVFNNSAATVDFIVDVNGFFR